MMNPSDEVLRGGYISTSLDPPAAMFQRTSIPIPFTGTVTHLRVCSGFLIYVMVNREMKVIRRANMASKTDEKDDIEFRDDDVENIYMDPTGDHVIISMASESNYYLHRLSKSLKILSKFSGHIISAVAWNDECALRYTGPLLVGTKKGLVFETSLVASEEGKFRIASSAAEQYAKQLYDIGDFTVSGLAYGRVTTGQQKRRLQSHNIFILLVTSGRLYQFFGTVGSTLEGHSVFQSIFEAYKDIQEVKYVDLPANNSISQLLTYRKSLDQPVLSFAWMASPGIYCGNIDNTVRSGDDSVILNHKLIEYQQDGSNSSLTTTSVLPNSIAMTEFHILMLSENRLRVICTLNEKQVWEDVFDSRDQVKNIWRDPVKGYIWINAKKGVYRYKVVQESRNIWKILLDMKEYDKARFHCGQDQEKLDIVNRQQANSLFEAGKYETSAQYYAQTRMSFEEITLKFIEANKEVALRGYLEKKLDNYRPEENKVQAIMLVTWLVEIWLNQLGKLSDQMDSDGSNKYEQEREILQEEFRLFLAKGNIRSVLNENKSIIYDLIASHGDVKDLVFFADLMKDYEKVISHQLQNHEFEKALEQLERVGDARLVYKFSPLLMQHVPSATVDLWQTLSPYHNPRRPPLDPKKLIPSLVQYDVRKLQSGQTHDAIRFLEYCIRTLKNKDQTIHNYLISLYADFDPEKLLKYLRVQGQEADAVNYDLKYALRLCSEKNLHKACIHIYSTMGLYSEAVNLALEQTDMSLAQENAQKPEEYDERKKLWLDVARHVVEKQKNIDSAMKVLKDCDLLKIEDILPFFPDFVTIDKFKEAITKSLAEYNEHINSLKADMNEATKSADQIRQQIQDFRKKSGTVRTTDKCSLCSFPLVTRSFYLFPCHHKFHSDCLIAEVLPSLSSSIRATVEELQRKVASREDAFSITSNTSTSFTQSAKAELDELVAAECIYCGEQIIRTIDEPFIALDEYGAATEDWD